MERTICTNCGDHNTYQIKNSFISGGIEMPSGKPSKSGWVKRRCCWCGYKFNERVTLSEE